MSEKTANLPLEKTFEELVMEYNVAENNFNWATTKEQIDCAIYRLLAARQAIDYRVWLEKQSIKSNDISQKNQSGVLEAPKSAVEEQIDCA